MKTFRKSSLISSIALLLVAIVALGGATFAWFSSNPTATASGISTSAKAASGLLITTDNTDETSWTNALTLYEGEAKSLTPVSSNFENLGAPAWYTANAETAANFDANEETITPVTDTNGYVDKYTVYAKTQDGTEAPLYISAAINETAGNFGRVAIVCDGTIVYYKNDTTEAWAPLDKDGNVAETKGFTETSSIASAEIGTIPADGTLAITIYVWNEGQDPGCTTNTSVEALTANFSFSLNK